MFIVFEGSDGCGKTTYLPIFKDMLEKYTDREIVLTREPGGTAYGEALRKVVLSKELSASSMTELLTMMTIRNQHIEEVIKPALEQGKIVLCDRFHLSTIAYQCIPNNIDEDFYYDIHHHLWGEFYPDLTFIFHVEKAIVEQRKIADKKDRFESRDSSFYEQLDAFYRAQLKRVFFNSYKSVVGINNNGAMYETINLLTPLAIEIADMLKTNEVE